MDLKPLRREMRAAYKGVALGPFTVPMEGELLKAQAAGQLQDAGPVIVLSRKLAERKLVTDFAARVLTMTRSDLYASHFVPRANASDAEVAFVAEQLRGRSVGGCAWVEVFEELEQPKRVLERCGFLHAATVVTAYAELKGLYFGGSAAALAMRAMPFDRADTPGLSVIEAGWLSERERQGILSELERAEQASPWVDHYSLYNIKESWSAFALRGYRHDDPGFIIKPAEMSRDWKKENPADLATSCCDTVLAKQFPKTMKVVARLPGLKQRVRFMRLRSKGGELRRHSDITDREAGTRDGFVSRWHIPIVSSPHVRFTGWGMRGEKVEMVMPERALCYLDMRKPHQAKNDAPDVERIHLVIDAYGNDQLRGMLRG